MTSKTKQSAYPPDFPSIDNFNKILNSDSTAAKVWSGISDEGQKTLLEYLSVDPSARSARIKENNDKVVSDIEEKEKTDQIKLEEQQAFRHELKAVNDFQKIGAKLVTITLDEEQELEQTEQLPPSLRDIQDYYKLTGTCDVLKELGKKTLVVLRDGRTLIGFLRSIDQYDNLLLENAVERLYVDGEYGDIERAMFVVRGDNLVLLGEVDEQKEASLPLTRMPTNYILEKHARRQEELEKKQMTRNRILRERGLPNPESFLDEF